MRRELRLRVAEDHAEPLEKVGYAEEVDDSCDSCGDLQKEVEVSG